MYTVSLERSPTYDYPTVRRAMERLLLPLGGMAAFVRPGERVLLKPNMLSAKPPEAAVTTHPSVLRAAIELVKEAGAIPLVGDSPGIGGIRRVAERSGMLAVIEESAATLVPFEETRETAGGGTFRRFALAVPYLEADRVINLPKLKTHEMMTMTCAVKNLFGAVVGAEKPAWHLQAGADRELFARMLLEIHQLRPPDLTIVDAVVAMEGNGPASGDPRQLGLLMAGANAVAIDLIAAEIAGIPKKLLFVERQAERMGLPGADRGRITMVGLSLDEFRVAPFLLPPLADVQFGVPGFLRERLRHHLTTRPVPIPEKCRLCGICRDACPPGAMTIRDGRLLIDYRRCIRCFCCRELCPDGALTVREGAVLKCLKRFM